MSWVTNFIQKPLQMATFAGAMFLPLNDAEAQNGFYYQRPYWGQGPYGAAGSFHAQSHIPIYNYYSNPRAWGPPPPNFNQRQQGQQLAQPSQYQSNTRITGPGFQGSFQSSTTRQGTALTPDPQGARRQSMREAIDNAKLSPDGKYNYILNFRNSKFHLIIPKDPQNFSLPNMNGLFRGKTGRITYYLVTNDMLKAADKEQPSPVTSSLKKHCCCN